MIKFLPLFVILLSSAVGAETLEIEYSSFYNHIKKLSSEDNNALQFAFGFKLVESRDLCHIQSAHIHTPKVDIPVQISAEQRFILPNEKALKMANAKVVMTLLEPANRCDMSVQLETKQEYLKRSYTAKELNILLQQYQSFFDDMGSFLSFLMPSVQGLVFDFGPTIQIQELIDVGPVMDGKLKLTQEWLEGSRDLELPHAPLRIAAWMAD